MTNSCPEASNVWHLDKYNLELIGKARLWDRSQPLTPLQPSPPWPHTAGYPLPSANRVSVASPGQDLPGPSLPLVATLWCIYTRTLRARAAARLCRQVPWTPQSHTGHGAPPSYRVGFNPLCAGRRLGRCHRVPAQKSKPGARCARKGIAHGRAACLVGAEMPARP